MPLPFRLSPLAKASPARSRRQQINLRYAVTYVDSAFEEQKTIFYVEELEVWNSLPNSLLSPQKVDFISSRLSTRFYSLTFSPPHGWEV